MIKLGGKPIPASGLLADGDENHTEFGFILGFILGTYYNTAAPDLLCAAAAGPATEWR
jgi:hypothetical protein